jgi:hypothetical protein
MHQDNPPSLYSQGAIGIATYLGGPLAAGILARQNFINLGNEAAAKKSLFIGIISTVFLFGGIFSIPEEILDQIPNALIPFVYTAIIYIVIEKFQGAALKAHKGNGGIFYSVWKAVGIGAICMLVLLAGIVGFAFMAPEDFDTKKYDAGMEVFKKNEENALLLFAKIETSSTEELLDYLDKTSLPAWKENLLLLDDLDKIEGLYEEFKKQNDVLRDYSELQVEKFGLIRKAIDEDTNAYDEEIEDLNLEIDEVLDDL